MLTSKMFATPKKAFCLPSYAGGLAQVFSAAPSPIPARTFRYKKQVLDFLNVEAMQAEGINHNCSPS